VLHFLDAVPVVVQGLGVFEHPFRVHPDDVQGDERIGAVVGDLDLPHLSRPVAEFGQHYLALLSGDRRAHRAVVEGAETRGGQASQHLHPFRERREEQRLQQPVVIAEPGDSCPVGNRPGLDIARGDAAGVFQHREQFLPVELLGVVEAHAHGLGKRLVAPGDHIEQIADRHDVPELERVAMIH